MNKCGWEHEFGQHERYCDSTPGPWTMQPIGDETECNILGRGRELIATVGDNDAPLIAAAPALLAALEGLLTRSEGFWNRHGEAANTPEHSAARAALRAAKGERA